MPMEIGGANPLEAVASITSSAANGLSNFAHKAMGMLGNIAGGLLSKGAQSGEGAGHSGGLGHVLKDLGEAALSVAAPEIGLPLKAAEVAKDALSAGKGAETIARDLSPAEHEASQAAKAWGEAPSMLNGAPKEMAMSDNHPTRGGLNESYYHPDSSMQMATRGPLDVAEHAANGVQNFTGGAHNMEGAFNQMLHPLSHGANGPAGLGGFGGPGGPMGPGGGNRWGGDASGGWNADMKNNFASQLAAQQEQNKLNNDFQWATNALSSENAASSKASSGSKLQ